MRALHLFAGIGGGALGFQRAGFETVGAVDFDGAACRDFALLVGRPCTHGDLSTMSPAELAAACTERPDVVFTSPPCKGFSGCLPSKSAALDHYQAMNALTLRGIWLALKAWAKPPALILLENVPRIMTRGREWLERIEALLRGYGYATARSTHDCGELGGIAQHRRRFLLVARHQQQVPAYIRVPVSRRVRGIGEVLGDLPCPVPGSTEGGPMHRLPKLSALNWVRLALIPAGGDWRDLPERVLLTHRAARQNGGFGVEDWAAPSHAVVGHHDVRSTWGSVADPRVASIAARHDGTLGVEPFDGPAHTVMGQHGRRGWDSVADPRVGCVRREGGHGVKAWAEPSHCVRLHNPRIAPSAIVDARLPELDGAPLDIANKQTTYLVIRAADGTWHRPLTTLELAALQGFPVRGDDGSWLVLGGSHAVMREHIGNAVPPPAAEAIAMQCRTTLLAATAGGFTLDNGEIWV